MKLVLDPNGICRKTGRLKGKQTGICEKEPEMLREMSKGAKMAIKECEFQFRNRQWNCTTVRRSMRKVLERGKQNVLKFNHHHHHHLNH